MNTWESSTGNWGDHHFLWRIYIWNNL